eukprot:CAMPEP_0194202242 /NCGR_PEP_ID=MMETSP0156-20130528/2317_1 /TAXON_ID=33649 /ORGANISM="Thalassionema nitzschioides, Strain L26-B" /LENGTH=509 /DNA_ID=CAMNT_0038927679 /DNA_START=186 /DNA_END=1715 /DNA_ORIENTATION=+
MPSIEIQKLDRSTSLDNSSDSGADPGELNLLVQALELEEEAPPLTRRQSILERSNNNEAVRYGAPLSKEEAKNLIPKGSRGGLVWKSLIIPDDFIEKNGKLMNGLNPRDFNLDEGTVKERRASLLVTQTNFVSSLTKVDDNEGGGHPRYIWYGILNGWPSLRCFELVALEERRGMQLGMIPNQMQLMASSRKLMWKTVWDVTTEGGGCEVDPCGVVRKNPHQLYRATLRGIPWTSFAWAENNPGFVFWYEPHHANGPRFTYGMELTRKLSDDDICTKIHMLSHRYALGRKESARDRITYHSVCVLEWEHGQYCSVLELAYLNGIGGYQGKSNFYDDRDAKPTNKLFQAFPPELIQPWLDKKAEIRGFDVEARNFEEFKKFVLKYEGNDKRFVDPVFNFSHEARLTFRSKAQIARYLINYATRDADYATLKRNCQTFAADFCAFVAGKKNVSPYSGLVSTAQMENKAHYFLYDSYAYESVKDQSNAYNQEKKQRQEQLRNSFSAYRSLTD